MTIYYSSSTRGFYNTEVHGNNIPEDKVEITHEYHQELIQGQCEGMVIASEGGAPILACYPVPTTAEQILIDNDAILRQIRDLEINVQPRAMRDFLLYEDSSALVDLDNQIITLRAQLK